MRRKRARNLFWTLTLSAGVYALIGPGLHGVQATAATLYAPVSWPAYRVSLWTTRVLAGGRPLDAASPNRPRALQAVLLQNDLLRSRVVSLEGQLEVLAELNRDRERLGKTLRPRLAPARVVGRDGEILNVLNSDFATFRVGFPVLEYDANGSGIAGLVSAVGAAAAQVRLVSDPGFVATGRFVRYPADSAEPVYLPGPRPLVEGAGRGRCRVARQPEADLDAAGVRVGDWVTLDDRDWPEELTGQRIGRVTKIEPLADKPGFARVDIDPTVDFAALKEVMVMVR